MQEKNVFLWLYNNKFAPKFVIELRLLRCINIFFSVMTIGSTLLLLLSTVQVGGIFSFHFECLF